MLLLLAQSFRAYWCELVPQFFHRILRPLDLKRGDVVERLEMKGEERKRLDILKTQPLLVSFT